MRSLPALQRSHARAGPGPAAPPCRGKPAAGSHHGGNVKSFLCSRNSLLSPRLRPCQLASRLRGRLEILGGVFQLRFLTLERFGSSAPRVRVLAGTGSVAGHGQELSQSTCAAKTVENVTLRWSWGGKERGGLLASRPRMLPQGWGGYRTANRGVLDAHSHP